MKAPLAPGIRLITSFSRDSWYRGFILFLTFLFYTAYHLSRKPISIVKVSETAAVLELHRNCSTVIRPANLNITNNVTWCDWQPFDQDNYQTLFGVLDNSFLVAYAIGMFFSGIFGERLSLRYYLSFGMVMSGLFTSLFGLGFYWNIHSLGYYAFVQIMNGLMQTTGWPAVVACVGNWFGKGKRGFIMGVWNSHTSVGNILGSLIAGAFVSSSWGLSFIVPGIIIASTGVLCFFFLVESTSCSEGLINGAISGEPQEVTEEHSKAISFCGALSIPGVVEFSLCLLFAKLVSYTFLYWLPLYISNVAHFDAKEAGDMSTLFDVGGILGGVIAGLISDYTGGRATTCCVMLIFAAPMVRVYFTVRCMLLVCGSLVNGPYALITTAVSADLGTHESLRGNSRALSTVTAIIDGTGSIGAALGPLFAGLISPTGWNNVFYMLISADILACLVSSFISSSPQSARSLSRRSGRFFLTTLLVFILLFFFQFLLRLVYKEVRGWCGHVPRARR
uniref:Glucose-6-phosphate exchanger SLC37A2 n=1 Tax=Salarias fasciatus TaxID=181472 RepID=A0A672HKB3_SALFA